MKPSLTSEELTARAVSPSWSINRVFDDKPGDACETTGRIIGNVVGFGVLATLVWVVLPALVF